VGALLRQAGVAAIYLIALVLFRQVSINHWILLSGFHLAVLMLVPYRYWPALFVGDFARLAYVSYTCLDQFGPTWALINLIPGIAYEAPVVWWFRERRRLFPSPSAVNMLMFVACALVVAFVATGVTLGQVQLTPLPPGYVIHYGEVIARLTLGNFMGILTVTPTVLVIQQSVVAANGSWNRWWHEAMDSRLFLESVFAVVPSLGLLGWIGHTDAHARGVAQMAMFLPVVIMAMRHGWKGAAVAGTMASIGIVLLMPVTNDHATLQAETLVALSISTMLLVGARVAALDRKVAERHADMQMALALAQRNVHLGEAQMRATAVALDQCRDTVEGVFNLMLGRLRHLQPVIDDAGYRRHVFNTQEQLYRLTDTLQPVAMRERGLPAALVHGALPRQLNEAGLKYWCDLRGPVSYFPQALQLSIYRIVAEGIALACSGREVSEVLVKIRCGLRHRPWVVLMIETRRQPGRVEQVKWEPLLSNLRSSASGLGKQAIEDRAATFEGRVRERRLREGQRLVVSLLEPRPNQDQSGRGWLTER